MSATSTVQDLCNAQVKKGSKLHICGLAHNHLPPHQDGDVEWEDTW